MGAASEAQTQALDRIRESRAEDARPRGAQPLEAFREAGEEGLSVSDLLIRFTDSVRLARAEAMEDEVTVSKLTPTLVEAKIKDYSIRIDLEKRVVSHDCDDWRKNTGAKKMCKHVDRLFLILPPGEARRILEKMWESRDDWSFEA